MRELTLGKMLLVLATGMILSFIIFGPECDDANNDAPECRENICIPSNN